MKKAIALLLILTLFICMGCAQIPDEKDSTGTQASPAPDEPLQYPYSETRIESGSASIRPISILIWSEETVEEGGTGQNICADGSGRAYFFQSKESDHNDLPTLTLAGELTAVFSGNTRLVLRSLEEVDAEIHIYDTDYRLLKYAFHDFSKLGELPVGEYVIAFTEHYEERNATSEIVGEYDCIFKLIVPEK